MAPYDSYSILRPGCSAAVLSLLLLFLTRSRDSPLWSLLEALLFRLCNAIQLGLNVAQGAGNLFPGVILLFEGIHGRGGRLIISDMSARLNLLGFPLFGSDGLLKQGLHARGLFKETRDKLGAFLRFHGVLLSSCWATLVMMGMAPRCD